MTETQKRIKAYRAALPGLKERVAAVALLLAMSVVMMTSATFAWLTISRAPELSGVTTNLAANGNLEIALASGDGETPPGDSKVGDSSATDGQSISAANLTWGNMINLSDPSYGLDNLALRPAQLNTAALLTKPLYGAVYDSDGRIKNLTTNYGYTAWIPAEGNKPAHFGVSDDVGVRAISSIKREQMGFAADYSDAYGAVDVANNMAANTFTAITKNQTWMNVLAKLLGTHMTASLNSEDKYKNATIEPADMETLIAMYEEFVLAHTQEAEAIAQLLNLQMFAAYGGNTAAYSPYTLDDILAINPDSDSRIKANGDFEEAAASGTKTIRVTNLKAFLKDYKQLNDDLTTLNAIHEKKDYRWTASGLYKVVERLMNVNQCLIKKTSESSFKTIQQLMNDMSSNPLSALGYMGSSCDIVITNGVLYNLEQRVGSSVSIQGMKVTAKMYVSTMNLGEQTANITAYVTTSAEAPSYFKLDLDHADTLNTGADTSSGVAVAEDTYALAVDFWARTNSLGSYLTLEGNVLLGEAYEVPVMTEDASGNQVQLYRVTRVFTDEETGETITSDLDVYKKESDGTVTWYAADGHRELTAEELGDAEPVAQVEEKRDVIGYEGENRVWDRTLKNYITTDSTTQGAGSCYVYYADTPEDQARSLELLKHLTVAFVDKDGTLLATASMDTENYYGNSGRFVVPLKVNNDGVAIITKNEAQEEVVTYAITALPQNEPTRITAIVYLDGRELGNEDVLSAADIQGQLNIQFSNNMEMKPIDNEKLEYETRKVTATVDNTSFNYDTHVGDMISTVTVHVDGDEPTNVRAFFQRKINATQGSREEDMPPFEQDEATGNWISSYTFKAPGVYVLRSVYLDGVEYVLKEPVEVRVAGFTVQSLTCDQITGEDRHIDILTAENSSTLDLKLKFATDDESKLPTKVQGRFLHNEDGSAINVDFTYNATTTMWSGTAKFLNSGEYTMQYLVLNGEYVELDANKWLTANVKLGMKTAVYTTDITTFKFLPDEMVEKGTDELQMQVKLLDNADNALPGLQDVKLTYRLRRSSKTIDVNLTWNAASRYYEGDLQALSAGPGIWEFDKVTIGETNIITNATAFPVFQMQSPEPPSFVKIGGTGMQYRPDGDAKMEVTLKYSATATVAAVFKDAAGNRYPVMGTDTDAGNNETTWKFAVPKNASGGYSGKQDGYWTLETVYLWNYYKADGTYVEWAKDEKDNVLGGLSVNADGSLVSNPNRDDANVMAVDIKIENNGTDYTVKVVQSITVNFAPNQSKNFGKDASGTVTGAFMQKHTVSGLSVDFRDFEGKGAPGVTDVQLIFALNGQTVEHGGYSGSSLSNATEGATITVSLTDTDGDGHFTQAEDKEILYAGKYSTEFSYKVNGVTTTTGGNTGKNLPANAPVFEVWSKSPTVTIDAISPSGSHKSMARSGNNSKAVDVNSSVTGNTVTIYAEKTNPDNGTVDTTPSVTLRINNLGNAQSANMKFTASGGGTVYMYTNTGMSGRTDTYSWTNSTPTYSLYIGQYKSSGSCRSMTYEGAGTLISNSYITVIYDNVEYTFAVDPITIINNNPPY